METKKCFCPKCGSDNLQTIVKNDTETHGKSYSASQGCCGALLLGPFGLLCGLCGQGQQTTSTNTSMFACNQCGHEFVKRDELVEAKENSEKAVETAEKRLNLSLPFAAIWGILVFVIMAAVTGGEGIGLILFLCLIMSIILGVIIYIMSKKTLEDAEAKLSEVESDLNEYDEQQKRFAEKSSNGDNN